MVEVAGLCHAERSCLIMVDAQTRLLGAMAPEDRTSLVERGRRLLEATDRLEIPVLATEQYPKGLGGTEETLRQAAPETTRWFDKTCFSCCGARGFGTALVADRPQTVLFGMETHVCVLQTALELQAQGKEVFVVEDAVCSRSPENRTNALARLRQSGVIVTNSESVLFEWLGDARHEHFKALTAALK